VPKKVDHRERRTLIADALMRVAADHGLEAVSLRHVATEAGVSSGMVQHYFRTKDEMMTFALEVVSENIQARLMASVGDPERPRSPVGVVRALLAEMLPFDETRRIEGRVMLAFLAYAAGRPAVAEALRETTAQMHGYVADGIRAAQGAGEASADIDPVDAAAAMLALVEGLGLHVLGGHYDAGAALRAFDSYLGMLFGTPPG
jgi:AcrR family transcriptional regulator